MKRRQGILGSLAYLGIPKQVIECIFYSMIYICIHTLSIKTDARDFSLILNISVNTLPFSLSSKLAFPIERPKHSLYREVPYILYNYLNGLLGVSYTLPLSRHIGTFVNNHLSYKPIFFLRRRRS